MKNLPPLHRGPARRLSLAPLIICVGALALPAAWDLSQSRNPARPTLSALHFGAMPSAGAACGQSGSDEKSEARESRPTPICHPTAPKAPALPSISLVSTIQRLFY